MYKEKKMKRLFATLLVGVLLFNLTACGNASPSTADTSKSEASSTTEAPSISTDQETEESDNKQVASEEIYPDGLWTIDRIEGIADQKQSEDAIKTLQSYCTCILGNSVYTFDNVGWGRYSTLTLEEEGSKDSPVDIGYCNKYSTKTDSATEISYMSNDYWVMPVNQSDGSVVSFIYKNTKVVPSGQAFALNDEQSADAFTEETRTDSIENIEYLVPASWGVNDTAVPNAIIYSPTQDTTQYYFMCRPNEVKESITGYHGDAVSQPDDDESSDRRNVLSAFVESMNKDLDYISRDDDATHALNQMRLITTIFADKKYDYKRIPELNGLQTIVEKSHDAMLDEKRASLYEIVQSCMADIHKDANVNEDTKLISDRADKFYSQQKEAIAAEKSLRILDGVSVQLWGRRDEAVMAIDAAKAPKAEVKPPVGPVGGDVPPTPPKKEIIKKVARQQMFPAKVLKTDEEIDAYVENIRKQMKQYMQGSDGIQITN